MSEPRKNRFRFLRVITKPGVACARAVAAIVIVAMTSRIASADPAAERRLYEQAASVLQKLDDTQAAQLATWLTSANAYQRQAALLRYHERPSLMSRAQLEPLLALLDDREDRPLGDCVNAAFAEEPIESEGAWQHRAGCLETAKSNATLATGLLEKLARSIGLSGNQSYIAGACMQVLTVVERGTHGVVLSPSARAICPYRIVLQRATAPNQAVPVTHALLRLLLEIGVGPGQSDLIALRPLLQGSDPVTRELAALVVLLAAHAARGIAIDDAVRIANACIDDVICPHIVFDVRAIAIRGAAAPLGPALVRRLARPNATDQVETLHALVAIRPLPAGTLKHMVRLLGGTSADRVLAVAAELDEADARALRPAVVRTIKRMSDATLVLGALHATRVPLSGPEFRQVDAIYKAGCLNPPIDYGFHDSRSTDQPWCKAAADLLTEIAVERGFRFTQHR